MDVDSAQVGLMGSRGGNVNVTILLELRVLPIRECYLIELKKEMWILM
jgi:hypothetical protein